jgi:hypothetical protein
MARVWQAFVNRIYFYYQQNINMKFQALLFSIALVPLSYQCNNTSQTQTDKTKSEQAQTEQAAQQSQTDPSLAQAQTTSPDTGHNTNSSNNTNGTGNNKNPFGALIAKSDNQMIPPAKQIEVAKALGIKYMRAHIIIADWNGSNDPYDKYAAAGFKIILNINSDVPRNAVGDKKPVPFPTDMQAYSKVLNSILDKYKPELVVIENEEDNPGYHAGTAQQYLTQLKTAIDICHAKGLKVTNAGLTDRETSLLVYDDYVRNGKKKEADDFAKRVFPPRLLKTLDDRYKNDPQVAKQLEFGRTVLQGYKTLDLDYVNFHWYEPANAKGAAPGIVSAEQHADPVAFEVAVNFLKRVTGKPIITNEFGELNESPSIVPELLQKVLDAGMDYAIWYSADGGVGKAAGLQGGDGKLRQNGIAFRDFIKEHCQ